MEMNKLNDELNLYTFSVSEFLLNDLSNRLINNTNTMWTNSYFGLFMIKDNNNTSYKIYNDLKRFDILYNSVTKFKLLIYKKNINEIVDKNIDCFLNYSLSIDKSFNKINTFISLMYYIYTINSYMIIYTKNMSSIRYIEAKGTTFLNNVLQTIKEKTNIFNINLCNNYILNKKEFNLEVAACITLPIKLINPYTEEFTFSYNFYSDIHSPLNFERNIIFER